MRHGMGDTIYSRCLLTPLASERNSFPALDRNRRPGRLHPPRPLRRPLPRLHITHHALRRPLLPPRSLPHFLLTRGRPLGTSVRGRRPGSLGRDVRRTHGCRARSVAGSGAHSSGLGSRLAALAGDHHGGLVCWTLYRSKGWRSAAPWKEVQFGDGLRQTRISRYERTAT